MIKNYFKIAIRNIGRQRLTSIINISSLSVAMAVVVTIMVWVQNELSFDNYHAGNDRIYLLKNSWQIDKNPAWIEGESFYPLGELIKRALPEVESVTRMEKVGKDNLALSVNGTLFNEVAGLKVDSNWFSVFQYTFIQGSAAAFYNHPHSLVVTASKAKKLFGTIEAVNKTVLIDSVPYNITGVVKDNRLNSIFQFDVILPIAASYYKDDWLYLRSTTFVKLKPAVNIAATEKKVNGFIKANSQAEGSITASLLPLKKVHFANDFTSSAFKHSSAKLVAIFSTLALILLLAAAINYVNLSIARITVRAKEMGIRKISGASRGHLFIQMIAEAVVTSAISLLLTIVLVSLLFPLLKTFSGVNFIFTLFDPAILFILAGTLTGIILLTGIYPAILLSSFKPAHIIGSGAIPGLKNSFFKKILVTAQFALAVFMIVAAIIVYRQLAFIQKQDVAYNRSQVFIASIPFSAFSFAPGVKDPEERRDATLNTIKQELRSVSHIKNASRSDLSSLANENFTTSNGLDWDGRPDNFEPEYISYSVDADIDSIMHFKMAAGRWFNEKNTTDKNNIILNETAVKRFGLREPVIGKRFNKGVIIGVAKDFFHQSLHEKIGALVIRSGTPRAANFIIQSTPGHVSEALKATEATWKKYFPGTYFQYSFADEDFAAVYKNDSQALTFTMIFSILSILICCMGLLGMTVFMTEQRRKEIGIRKVIGATVTNIVGLITKGIIKLVLIAILIASPVAGWCMNKWLQDYAYRAHISPWIYIAAGLLAIAIALLTMSFQSIKAALANPVKSLRNE